MTILIAAIILTAVAGIAATIRQAMRDGYHQEPVRSGGSGYSNTPRVATLINQSKVL